MACQVTYILNIKIGCFKSSLLYLIFLTKRSLLLAYKNRYFSLILKKQGGPISPYRVTKKIPHF